FISCGAMYQNFTRRPLSFEFKGPIGISKITNILIYASFWRVTVNKNRPSFSARPLPSIALSDIGPANTQWYEFPNVTNEVRKTMTTRFPER
ncbi:MAG: hypothetical protein EBT35_08630, partial [Alphaproteobacteria bacterium]|nr:hypothetical protein [Alphaproteobacteria bacterium]